MRDEEIEKLVRALKRAKARRGFSLRGLAILLGVSKGHLSMILTGKRRPGLRFLRAAIEKLPELRRLLENQYRSSPPPEDKPPS